MTQRETIIIIKSMNVYNSTHKNDSDNNSKCTCFPAPFSYPPVCHVTYMKTPSRLPQLYQKIRNNNNLTAVRVFSSAVHVSATSIEYLKKIPL